MQMALFEKHWDGVDVAAQIPCLQKGNDFTFDNQKEKKITICKNSHIFWMNEYGILVNIYLEVSLYFQ